MIRHFMLPNVITPVADSLRAEIAVIGSGPGGAVTAALLADAGRDVLLIEEGPNLSLNSAAHFSREEIVQKYRNGGITVGEVARKCYDPRQRENAKQSMRGVLGIVEPTW